MSEKTELTGFDIIEKVTISGEKKSSLIDVVCREMRLPKGTVIYQNLNGIFKILEKSAIQLWSIDDDEYIVGRVYPSSTLHSRNSEFNVMVALYDSNKKNFLTWPLAINLLCSTGPNWYWRIDRQTLPKGTVNKAVYWKIYGEGTVSSCQ
ncbi:MAG: hypothetical protein OCD76_19450 [Reichenbachiella sp.]